MNKKKVLAMLLACLMLASATGCSSAPETAPAETTTDNVQTTETTPETQPEYVAPEVSYDGTDFCFLDYQTDDYFWQAATYSDIHSDGENGEVLNDALYKRNLIVEDELDFKLSTYPVGGVSRDANAKEFRNLVMADEDTIQAGFIFGILLPSLMTESNLLQDFRSIPTLDTEASWWHQDINSAFVINDQLRVMTGDISLYTAFSPVLFFFNKQLAEDYQLTETYDLVREGKWTLDKMIESCYLVTVDLNGDGAKTEEDQYGLAVGTHMLNEFIYGGGQQYIRSEDGNMKIVVNTEKTISIIEKVVPFINDTNATIAHHNYTSKYSNVFYDMFIPMFQNDLVLFYNNQLLISFELRAMETDFGLLPMPKYDEAQENYVNPISHSWNTMLCIPATNQVPEMTGHVLNAMGYYSQQYVTPAFIDTTVRNKALRDTDSAEMLELILDTLYCDTAMIYDWGKLYSRISGMTAQRNTSFASLYASIEKSIQTDMEKALTPFEN